jgi:acyl-coenzyme A synthetase/AMP-(fatty) acid ligase
MPTQPLIHNRAMESIIAYDKGRPITINKFLFNVYYLAQRFPDNSRMLNLCDQGYGFLTGFCAALVSGKTNILPPNRAPETLKNIQSQFEGVFCLTSGESHGLDSETIIFSPQIPQNHEHNKIPNIPCSLEAAITFTSGSTGSPKPQAKSWESMVTIAKNTGNRLIKQNASHKTIIATVPPQHMYGLETAIMLSLQSGCSLNDGRPFFPADIKEALESVPEGRVWVTTPLQIKTCVAESIQMPDIDIIISATAHLSESLATQAENKFGANVYEIYGCTEAGSIATRRTVDGMTWTTLDKITLVGNKEECLVKAPYLESPILLHDIIDNIDNKHFSLLGRSDDLVKIEGKRASLLNLNFHLNEIDGVVDGIIFIPQENREQTKRVVAFVLAPDISLEEILTKLRLNIDPTFLPRPIYKVECLPRSDSGKLTKDSLMDMYDSMSQNSANCIWG